MTEQQIIESLATKVMGWKKGRGEDWDGYNWFAKDTWTLQNGQYQADGSWNPLQNIADAWMLVDKLYQQEINVRVETFSLGLGFYCEIENHAELPWEGRGETAQKAISMAAYKMVT